MPVANSRWMTRSCRSRPIRSRSASTAPCSASSRRSASSRATAACAAKPCRSSTSSGFGGVAHSAASTPGTGTVGPERHREAVRPLLAAGRGRAARAGPAAAGPPAARRPRPGRRRRLEAATCRSPPVDQGHEHAVGLPARSRASSTSRAMTSSRSVPGQQRRRDRPARLPPGAAAPGLLVQAGVADRDAGGRGQGDERPPRRPPVNSCAVELVGEVEVAEHDVADPHGHAEEGAHRRVARREADGRGVLREVAQPQRLGCAQELAEHAEPARRRPDARRGGVVDADGDELAEPLAGRRPRRRARRTGRRPG